MKRAGLFWLILTLILSSTLLTTSAQEENFVTALQNANVRERPSTAARILTALPTGENAVVLAQDTNGESVSGNRVWYQVQLSDGTEGWVWSGAVRLVANIRFQADFETTSLRQWDNSSAIGRVVEDGDENHILQLENYSHNFVVFTLRNRSWEDYAVEARVRIVQSTRDHTDFFLNVREAANANYAASLDVESTAVGLTANMGGVFPTLGTASAPIYQNQWVQLRIEVQGEDIRVFVNERRRISVEDSAHTEGGISFTLAPQTIVEVDDFRVSELIDEIAVPDA